MTYALIAGCGFVAAVLLSLMIRSREVRGILFVVFLALTCVAIALIPSEKPVAKKKASIEDATALLHDGQYDKARDAFRELNAKKFNPDAVLGCAECSFFLGDDQDCITNCMILFKLHEHYGEAHNLLGQVSKKKGNTGQAKKYFEMGAKTYGNIPCQLELAAMGG